MAPEEVICKACSHGPCKLSDLAYSCAKENKPADVDTVQDMVNYLAIQGWLDKV